MRLMVVGVLLALTIPSSCSWRTQDPRSEGPVAFQADPDLTQTAGILADAGHSVVFGATHVKNTGTSAATLQSAALLGEVPSDAAEVADVRAVDPADHDGELVGAGPWPFEDYGKSSEPLEGYSLAPGTEAELLFIVEVHKTGTWHWPRTQLTYESDGEVFEDVTTVGFMVCPTDTDGGACHPGD